MCGFSKRNRTLGVVFTELSATLKPGYIAGWENLGPSAARTRTSRGFGLQEDNPTNLRSLFWPNGAHNSKRCCQVSLKTVFCCLKVLFLIAVVTFDPLTIWDPDILWPSPWMSPSTWNNRSLRYSMIWRQDYIWYAPVLTRPHKPIKQHQIYSNITRCHQHPKIRVWFNWNHFGLFVALGATQPSRPDHPMLQEPRGHTYWLRSDPARFIGMPETQKLLIFFGDQQVNRS